MDSKISKRKCQMILFQLEESLGSIIREASSIDALNDNRVLEISSRSDIKLATISNVLEESYLDEVFHFCLDATIGTSKHLKITELYKMFHDFKVFDIRNALAHPNKPFSDNYFYRVATIASDPIIAQIGLHDVTASLHAAEEGQLTDPPADWLRKARFVIPNNLPERLEHFATGLIGRNKELKQLEKLLENPRVSTISVIAPGGIGKTALVTELLYELSLDPNTLKWCDGMIFVTMKTERLTSKGIEKLNSIQTIDSLIAEIILHFSIIFDEEYSSLDEVKSNFSDKKMVLFIDNLETLLRDDPELFNEFNLKLPSNWRVIVTSRISLPNSTPLNLSELNEGAAKELALRYGKHKSIEKIEDESILRICTQCFCNPLAIKFCLDLISEGKSIPDSLGISKKQILEFSFSSLVDSLPSVSLKILEILFIEELSTKQSIFEILEEATDDLAEALGHLSRTSLIERRLTASSETFSLIPSVRELMLQAPKDLIVRNEIQEKVNRRKLISSNIEKQQFNAGVEEYHPDFIPDDIPEPLIILLNDCVVSLRLRKSRFDVIIGKSKKIDIQKITSMYKRFNEAQSYYEQFGCFYRFFAIIHALLRDSNTSRSLLEKSLERDASDIASKLLLARIQMYLENHSEAEKIYCSLVKQSEINKFNYELQKAVIKSFYLSLLYQHKYLEIIEETKDWKEDKKFKDLLGGYRASSYRRIAEQCYSNREISNFIEKINSCIGIYSEIFRTEGYTPDNIEQTIKIVQLMTYQFLVPKQNQNNPIAVKFLKFVNEHSSRIMQVADDSNTNDLRDCLIRLKDLDIQENPLGSKEWMWYLNNTDVGFISEEEALVSGYTIATVDHINKKKTILFAVDDSGQRYFSHKNQYQGQDYADWYSIAEGQKIALVPNYSTKGELPTADEQYIVY